MEDNSVVFKVRKVHLEPEPYLLFYQIYLLGIHSLIFR